MRFVDLGTVTPEYSVCADKVLLNSRSSDILMIYSRDRACISAGRFQKIEDTIDTEYAERNGISIVRRVSGGSCIYSDRDQVTYSLIVSKERLPASRNGSFASVCNAVVSGLKELGIDGIYKPVNDILVGGKKISGGAQARNRDTVLQHGSIILDIDDSVVTSVLKDARKRSYDGLTSVRECLGHIPSREVISKAILSGFSGIFRDIGRGELTGGEKESIEREVISSYRRGP
jgi:lipoate-protein ligase A